MIFSKTKKDKKDEKSKSNPQNPRILEVNLIKGELRVVFDWKSNLVVLAFTLFFVFVFVFEIYAGLGFWAEQEKKRADSLNVDISKIGVEINKVKDKADEAMNYRDKSVELGKLLGNHIYWSNFFSWIEKNTLSTVKFTSFSGDTKGVYTLEAQAFSFSEVSWQVKAFLNDPFVKKVSVTDVSSSNKDSKDKNTALNKADQSSKSVNFTLSFELEPGIFKK